MDQILRPILLIPARMGSTRLPGKPLADIHGIPMIMHVWHRGVASDIGPVIVAAAESEIVDSVTKAGGQALLTKSTHTCGSDRIHEAVEMLDPERYFNVVVNLQGDLPTIEPALIRQVIEVLIDPDIDVATAVVPLSDSTKYHDPNVVKVVLEMTEETRVGRVLYFSRSLVPWGDGPYYHHVGIYAFRRCALDRFIRLPRSTLEGREQLEQLRGLADGMRFAATITDVVPIGVDTPTELAIVSSQLAIQ